MCREMGGRSSGQAGSRRATQVEVGVDQMPEKLGQQARSPGTGMPRTATTSTCQKNVCRAGSTMLCKESPHLWIGRELTGRLVLPVCGGVTEFLRSSGWSVPSTEFARTWSLSRSLAESIYCNGVIKTMQACLRKEGLASLVTRLVLALFCAT